MESHSDKETLRLRAHHIFCAPSLREKFEERGQEFLQIQDKVLHTLLSEPETEVTLVEGNDMICGKCDFYTPEGCVSPNGNEDAVRKWDSILASIAGVNFGTSMTSGEWRALVKSKAPYKICPRCPWKQVCDIGETAT